MSNSKREQILEAVKTLIVSISGLETATFRSRQAAFNREETPSVIVSWAGDDPIQTVIPFYDWNLLLRITVYTRGDVPDSVADPFVQAIHKKLMDNQELGGLAMEIFPARVVPLFGEADLDSATISCDYRIKYRTTEDDIAV